MFVTKLKPSINLLKQLFSTSRSYQYNQIKHKQPPRQPSIYHSHRIFASTLLSSISQNQLCDLYFNKQSPACFHHSITLYKLLSFYRVNPPPSYFTKQITTILSTISSELDTFNAESLISVLNSLAEFPKGDHYVLLNLQNKILEILVGQNDLEGIDRISVLKLVNACCKINRFDEERERVIEVIKICLRKLANSIKKLSSRNILNLVKVIEQYQIFTRNTERALCKQAVERIEYLTVKEKTILLKGARTVKSKEMLGRVLENLKIENIKTEDQLEDVVELIQTLKQVQHDTVKQKTGSDIKDYEKYLVRHALNQYSSLVQAKQLISLNYVEQVLSICQKQSLNKQLQQLFSLFSTEYAYIKVQNRLPLVLFQLRHNIPITPNLLKTTQKKSKNIFPLIFQILQYPSSSNYQKIPQFQFLVNLSIRYFVHNIARYSLFTQLKRCKSLAKLFKESPAAYETFIKLVGKYLVEHTKYSDQTMEHLNNVQLETRYQSYQIANKQLNIDNKMLSVIQKMTSAVDLMYYTICIVEEMNLEKKREEKDVNYRILREIVSQFVKNFKLGYYPQFVTWDTLRKLGLIESYFERKLMGIKEIGEYYEREGVSEQQKSKMQQIIQEQGLEFNKIINGVKVDCVGKNKAYIFINQIIQKHTCLSLQEILLKRSTLAVEFINLQ